MLVCMSVYHVCVSVCMLLKDHALTEEDVNQWRRNDPWGELAAVCSSLKERCTDCPDELCSLALHSLMRARTC